MIKGRKRQNEKTDNRGARSIIVVSVVLLILIVGILCFSLMLPHIKAYTALREAVASSEASDGAVVLCDPYVILEILPEVREFVPDRETSVQLITLLTESAEHAQFIGRSIAVFGCTDPYICIKGDKATYFYLDPDSFQIEKNSTFYRFSPRNDTEKTMYAELYSRVMELLSSGEKPDA